jgi:pyruvate/2-oxoglutarate dehydrogenase complex dihydrolipoamide acyltransferase (E2) component
VDRIIRLSGNRHFILDLLARARRFHCSVSTAWQFDVTDLDAARQTIRVNGRPLGMTACLIKATGLVLAANPRLNRHLFTGPWKRYEVQFDTVSCTLIIMRKAGKGERILLPLTIERCDQLDVVEIQHLIDRHRFGKLETLPQFQAIERLKKLPRIALRWFSYKARSDHRFYRRYFGTYGMSEMSVGAFGPRGGHVVANTASAFVVGPLFDLPEVVEGKVRVRRMQGVNVVSDHYVLDGVDILYGMRTLERILAWPERLGIGGRGS